jgi:hypothetical protein
MFKFNFDIDAEFALALLGIFSIVLIMGIILFVSMQLGIQTYSVLEVGSPCPKVFCPQRFPAEEIGRDWQRGTAYCQCDNGDIRQAPLFAQ